MVRKNDPAKSHLKKNLSMPVGMVPKLSVGHGKQSGKMFYFLRFDAEVSKTAARHRG